MMETLKMACTFVVVGLILNTFSSFVDSNFLSQFLDNNLILLLVALMAINTTTTSVILTKMREITDNNPDVDFSSTYKSMKTATSEQVMLIVLAVVFQILKSSPWINERFLHSEFIFNSLLISIFAFAIHALYDTAHAVYVIVDEGP